MNIGREVLNMLEDTLVVELISYDYSNGVCEVLIKSDDKDLMNQFLFAVERAGLEEDGDFYDYSYHSKDGKEYKTNQVLVRWLHIDTVVSALKGLNHNFRMDLLLKARANQDHNFAYMNESQFYCLTDYIRNNLTVK